MARFADEELRRLSERLDQHIGDFKSYTERNDAVMADLSRSVRSLDESTKGVVTLFNEGAVGQKWVMRIGKLILFAAAIYGGVKLLFGK